MDLPRTSTLPTSLIKTNIFTTSIASLKHEESFSKLFNDWILKPLCALLGINLYEDEQIIKYNFIIASAPALEASKLKKKEPQEDLYSYSDQIPIEDSRGNTRNLYWVQWNRRDKRGVSLSESKENIISDLYFQEHLTLEDIEIHMQQVIAESVKEILVLLYADPNSINESHLKFLKFAVEYAENHSETCGELNDLLKPYKASPLNNCNGQELRWKVAHAKLTEFKKNFNETTKTEQGRLIADEVKYLLRLECLENNDDLKTARDDAAQFVVGYSRLFNDDLNAYALKRLIISMSKLEESDTLAAWKIAAGLINTPEEILKQEDRTLLANYAARYINYLNLKRHGIFNDEVRKQAAIRSFDLATNPRERYLAALELVNQTKRGQPIMVKNAQGKDLNYSDLAARYIWNDPSESKFKKPNGLEAAVLRTVLLAKQGCGEMLPKDVADIIMSKQSLFENDPTLLAIANRYNELFPHSPVVQAH